MATIDSANFHAEVNTQLLERLLLNDENEKEIRKIIAKVMKQASRHISEAARRYITKDPRRATEAVKYMVYRSILGGNVSILNSKRKSGKTYPAPSSSRKGARSKRTENLLTYYGSDRAFVLRFLNSGTDDRTVLNFNNRPLEATSEGRNPKRKYKGGIGNRGRIAARNWFPGASHNEMKAASDNIALLVSKVISDHFNNNK